MATVPTQVGIDHVRYPEFKPEVIEAMEEARRISRGPNIKGYTSVEELFEELDK